MCRNDECFQFSRYSSQPSILRQVLVIFWTGYLLQANRIIACLLILICSAPVNAEIHWHWQDRFSTGEQAKLTNWVQQTVAGVERLVGPYPFDIHITFHRRNRAHEPVPWGNTERSHRQGVHLHVDPSYPLEDFLADWTAPHELSHLILPYLGRHYAWFAEGFASYMQYQVMHEMGILSTAQKLGNYRDRIDRAEHRFRHNHMSFAAAAPRLRIERNYPVMYWGGAVFFLEIDSTLKNRHQAGLIEILGKYLACCRHKRQGLQQLVAELDRLSESDLFSGQLDKFRSVPGFPQYTGSYYR